MNAAGEADEAARWAWATVDLAAIEANVTWLRSVVAPAELWAVVKANGYGHGAVASARAARAGGATGLCVALVQEGVELRAAGIDGPILVLAEPPEGAMPAAAANDLRVTVYSPAGIEAAAAAASAASRRLPVHLKVDTGMQRVGAHPNDGVPLAKQVLAHASLELEGVFTHLAVADEPHHPGTARQLGRFDEVLGELRGHGIEPPVVHAANSAGGLAHPGARRSLVRAGIAVYGLSPSPAVAEMAIGLRPALSLVARVSHVKVVAAASQVSYGWRHTFAADTVVATIPIGYADGVPRRLSAVGGGVLVQGQRRPMVGVVTMDQLMVDCGPDSTVAVGDEVVLLGQQGDEVMTADDWAARVGTINYEIVCGIGARVSRRYLPLRERTAEGDQ